MCACVCFYIRAGKTTKSPDVLIAARHHFACVNAVKSKAKVKKQQQQQKIQIAREREKKGEEKISKSALGRIERLGDILGRKIRINKYENPQIISGSLLK